MLLLMLALVFAARAYFLRTIHAEWPTLQQEVNTSQAALINSRLGDLRIELHRQATSLVSDDDIVHILRTDMGEGDDQGARQRVITRMQDQQFSYELRDKNGVLQAYGGEPIRPQSREFLPPGFTITTQSPFIMLVATIAVLDESDRAYGTLSVATPLTTSLPVNERFLASEGVLTTLSRELEIDLEFSRLSDVRSDDRRVLVPFIAEPDTLGYVSFASIAEEAWREQIAGQFDRILLLLLFVTVLIASIPMFRFYRTLRPAVSTVTLLLHIWVVRIGFLAIDFAKKVFPDTLLNPAYFASTFGWGLTASPVELTLTLLAVLLSTVGLYRVILPADDAPRGPFSRLATVLLVFAVLPFTLCGFSAAIQSFVIDSTFNFDRVDGLLDEPMYMLMIGNSYLLSLALGFGLLAMYLLVKHAIAPLARTGIKALWISGGIVAGSLLFLLTTEETVLPLWAYGIYMLVFVLPLFLRVPPLRNRSDTLFAPLLATVILGSILTVVLFGHSMEKKRAGEIEAIAIDYARPVDGWSQVLMEQTLQYVARAETGVLPAMTDTAAADHEAAFRIWSGSPLSRLRNNSAILLLDSSGTPRSRFAVGSDPFLLSMHAMTETMERIEGIVQRTDRQLENRARRFYQGYTDLQSREHPGLVAVVVLEALDPMEMTGPGIDLLRNAPLKQSSAPEDRYIVSRFVNGQLVQTSNQFLERASGLPATVRTALADETETVWHTLPVEGEDLQTYFMRLSEREEEVLAITRGKSNPLLTAYRSLRIAVLYLAFSAVLWLFFTLLTQRTRHRTHLTFARKLQLALLGVAAIPLLLIWTTGRGFFLDNTRIEIERQLRDDLDIVRTNILARKPDSIAFRDITAFIDDQLCQELLLRTGKDVNVYRGTELIATSKPELYHVGLLNSRLNAEVWINIVRRGRDASFASERIGDYSYQVGYRAIRDADGSLAAVISTPTLFQRDRIDQGYTRASAAIFLWIAGISLLVLFASVALARQISRPLNELLHATRDITRGDLDRRVHITGSAEIVDLMHAFNTMTARLRKSQEELAAAERELAWKEMAKQVAHEIRNPLTPMKLAVQHLQRAWQDRAQHIGDIFEKVTHTLIDQIDSLSRISDEFSRFARMPKRNTARVDLEDILRETVGLFGNHPSIRFDVVFENPLPPVLADAEELARAFTNLLRNAVQAMHDSGTVGVRGWSDGHSIHITIRDSGSGIPPELQKRIFEPNFSTKTEGMGMGLSIVKKIIDDMEGDIRIESNPGEGTLVSITLPAA
ncbi:MAG: HAMP domain-containing protein [Bacteroidetes bacterium]|nr:HAMP domain-containing protein [Bacteroidota bacterium]